MDGQIIIFHDVSTYWSLTNTKNESVDTCKMHLDLMHCGEGVEGCCGLKIYCGWIVNYVHIMRGSAYQFKSALQEHKKDSPTAAGMPLLCCQSAYDSQTSATMH